VKGRAGFLGYDEEVLLDKVVPLTGLVLPPTSEHKIVTVSFKPGRKHVEDRIADRTDIRAKGDHSEGYHWWRLKAAVYDALARAGSQPCVDLTSTLVKLPILGSCGVVLHLALLCVRDQHATVSNGAVVLVGYRAPACVIDDSYNSYVPS
jgi:hypothetical protein